jgi:XTP/dITP diphosphohydrolase
MPPAPTGRRKARDGVKKDGRGVEISRLIGRALRQAVDRRFLGERTITIDCDVLEADGGTRTASITGGFVALVCAVDKLLKQGKIKESPIVHQIAAVSAGIVDDVPCLDLCYLEDSAAQTDMNFVMDETGAFVELQGTGEGRAFSRGELNEILALGEKGIDELHEKQREALGEMARHIAPKRTIVIASNNAHKIQEISHMLEDRLNVISMAEAGFTDEIDENGETFEENAAIKARAVAKATGYCALGDDSGLSVDALDGAPGVHSARYCGRHGDDKANNDLLIANMADIPAEDRTAEFVCAMALSLPNGDVTTVRGACPGVITFTPRGEGGFGYDPYFEYLSGETFAEMAQEEKNQISHRANAMRLMLPYLEEL